MEIDFAQLTAYQRYKLMASLIVPRPIALVTTLGANGVVQRRALLDVQHARRGPADRDAVDQPPARTAG
jgi:hypothetical protein